MSATHEISCAGVYGKLKDRSTSLEDKLKLLRFAWRSHDVFIPNKEQVLIDQLCGYLINRKKHQFTEDETGRIFLCLRDVLQSNKAHQKHRDQQQGLLVKQSLSQMIIDGLQQKTDSEGQGDYLSYVIGCCHAIITSPSLAYMFTDRLELMINLLCSLSTLLYNHITNSVDHDQLLLLIHDTTQLFVKSQMAAPNQNMILKISYEKLLPEFIKLFSLSQSDTVLSLRTALLNVFCHRDHTENYSAYFHGLYEEKVPDQIDLEGVKIIKQLFETLTTLIEKQTDQHEAVVDFMVQFYGKFADNKRSEDHNKVCYFILKKLCGMLCVQESDSAMTYTVDSPIMLHGLAGLLQVVCKHDLYNVSDDNRNKHTERNFYRCIAKTLLHTNGHTLDWYSCCHTLLLLNHHILEPVMTELLKTAFLGEHKQESADVLEKIEIFLSDMIVTYHKLRQFPAIVDILINTLKGRQEEIEIPTKFIQRYGECVLALPQGSILKVWKKYLDCMIEHCEAGGDADYGYFDGLSWLLYYFMINVKVIDYSTTEMTLTAVKDNLERMSTELFAPILQRQVDSDKIDILYLRCVLKLCHGWGELVAMVTKYCGYRSEELQVRTVHSQPYNISLLHSYLHKKHWKLLYKKIQALDNMALQYQWEELLVQKVRTIILCREVSEWSTVHESLDTLMMFTADTTSQDLTATWSGKVADIREDNIHVARWSLVVNNMSILYTNLSQEHMDNLAMFIVNTCPLYHGSNSKAMSVPSITQKFLQSTQFTEYGGLITCVITAVWRSLLDSLTGSKPRSKKRKSESGLESAMNVFKCLSDQNVDWKQAPTSDILEKLVEASTSLRELLHRDDTTHQTLSSTRLTSCLQVLKCLPLEHISSTNQMRCLMGLLSAMCLVDKQTDTQTDTQADVIDPGHVMTHCVEISTVILESMGTSPIFQVVDVESYVLWIVSLFETRKETDVLLQKMMLFTEVSCSTITKDYKVLVKLPTVIQKLEAMLPDSESDVGCHTGVLLVMMYLYQESSRILSRHHINEEIKNTCREIHTSLSTHMPRLLSQLNTQTFSLNTGIIVNMFSAMVQSSVKDVNIQSDVVNKCPAVLKWCESALQGKVDLYPQMAALHFYQSVSRSHQGLHSVITADVKLQIWNTLVSFLKDLLKLGDNGPASSDNTLAGQKSGTDNESTSTDCDEIVKLLMRAEQHSGIDKYKDLMPATRHTADRHHLGIKKHEDSMQHKHLMQENRLTASIGGYSSLPVLADVRDNNINGTCGVYNHLVYEGRLQEHGTRLLIMEVQAVMAAVLASFDLEHFTNIVQHIVQHVHPRTMCTDRQTVFCYLFVWQDLLKLDFSAQHSQIIQTAADKIVVNCHDILLQVQHHTEDTIILETVLPVLHSNKHMLNISNRFLSARCASMCLEGCLIVPLRTAIFYPVFQAICDVLDTLLMKHSNIVMLHIPLFIGCAKKLLVNLVKHCDQKLVLGDSETINKLTGCAYQLERLLVNLVNHCDQKLVVGDSNTINKLTGCAYQLERLFLEMSNHKVDFNKVAVYVISDYVTAVEHVTLLPVLKRAVLPSIYKMLDLCDNFAVSQLHKILSYGQVEVFKILYEEYKKFHMFSGKV